MNKVDNGMKYFSEPDIFGTFQPAPERIKTNVMNRLLPSGVFKYILFPFLLLVLSPLLVLFIDPIIVKDSLFIYFIATISILICVYS
ncbi:MAG: hypothetical protein K8R21_01505, partial [Leptospira sp.]|nr:hypothetical protein [Leptospira sp.]